MNGLRQELIIVLLVPVGFEFGALTVGVGR